jgi:hypothetical protein
MLSFSISYPDLIKLHYFTDTTERGVGGERRLKNRVGTWFRGQSYNAMIGLFVHFYYFLAFFFAVYLYV